MLDLEALGWENIFRRLAMLRARLAGNLIRIGTDIVTSQREAAGIISFRSSDAEALAALLRMRSVRVEARNGLVRVSPHFQTESEIDSFCEISSSLSRIPSALTDGWRYETQSESTKILTFGINCRRNFSRMAAWSAPPARPINAIRA
ncbi:MAG: hypothetical protein EOQ41_03980 [Mesorhizobium sp.]|uniref:hypothetical protein n=1 Tax=Mesorhizobium sp. TaxID=1871066 RepID=UPI000FE4FF08|nr:hypothetical protein [Mesorhizobium sp.]RWB35693.1 MAG: hypothetical protein EOQ41_03980 [Mesorhizobium sp.]